MDNPPLEVAIVSSGALSPTLAYLASLAPSSRRVIASRLASLARLLGSDAATMRDRWHTLRPQDLVAARSLMAERGAAPASINLTLVAVRMIARHAADLDLIGERDLRLLLGVKGARGHREPKGRALEVAEVRALLAACDADRGLAGARDACAIALMFMAGLRRAEACALDLSDIRGDTLLVRAGKGNKDRTLPLHPAAAQRVERWLEHRGRAAGPLLYALTRRLNRPTTNRLLAQNLWRILPRRARQAQIASFTPHDCRRTFVGELLDRGVDIATVQKLAGHTSPATTMRYDRRPYRTRQKAIGMLDYE